VSRYARQDEEAEIDLTPMLDVVFIMLIFFIVTASFLKESGIEITRPDSTSETPPEDSDARNIVFQVTANDEIWIEGRRVDIRAVRAVIDRLYAENPEAAVVISANKKSTARTYTSIANDARAAGNYSVTMVTTDD
jgi:biopolymer transport protein ExbD